MFGAHVIQPRHVFGQEHRLDAGHLARGGRITLANPRRFEREEFRKAKAEDIETVSDEFWFNIPGNLFIVMASDIANLNLRYIRRKPLSFQPSEEEREVLTRLLDRLKEGK